MGHWIFDGCDANGSMLWDFGEIRMLTEKSFRFCGDGYPINACDVNTDNGKDKRR